MTEEWLNRAEWKENVILVDADYVDKVVFNLIVNFERMIGRRIPQADMAKWLECVALDGGDKGRQSSDSGSLTAPEGADGQFPAWCFCRLGRQGFQWSPGRISYQLCSCRGDGDSRGIVCRLHADYLQ